VTDSSRLVIVYTESQGSDKEENKALEWGEPDDTKQPDSYPNLLIESSTPRSCPTLSPTKAQPVQPTSFVASQNSTFANDSVAYLDLFGLLRPNFARTLSSVSVRRGAPLDLSDIDPKFHDRSQVREEKYQKLQNLSTANDQLIPEIEENKQTSVEHQEPTVATDQERPNKEITQDQIGEVVVVSEMALNRQGSFSSEESSPLSAVPATPSPTGTNTPADVAAIPSAPATGCVLAMGAERAAQVTEMGRQRAAAPAAQAKAQSVVKVVDRPFECSSFVTSMEAFHEAINRGKAIMEEVIFRFWRKCRNPYH